jgi:hypothetical protein
MYWPSSSGSKSNPSKKLAASRARKFNIEINKLAGNGNTILFGTGYISSLYQIDQLQKQNTYDNKSTNRLN